MGLTGLECVHGVMLNGEMYRFGIGEQETDDVVVISLAEWETLWQKVVDLEEKVYGYVT